MSKKPVFLPDSRRFHMYSMKTLLTNVNEGFIIPLAGQLTFNKVRTRSLETQKRDLALIVTSS